MMPRKHTTWICSKCHKRFSNFSEAEGCELDHIVKETASDFAKDLGAIFQAAIEAGQHKEKAGG